MKNRTHDTGETKDLKKEIAATLKNQETQELIQRKNEYKEVHEEIPKTLDKKIPQIAVTLDQKSEKKKKTQVEKPKKPKKVAVKKTMTAKIPPFAHRPIPFAHKKPAKTFKNWKFIED
uniref:Uncharacterized protein n=1 Tax=Panagrolaimus superbus TaxID=310955 RepID=A0A914YWL1_9BILA